MASPANPWLNVDLRESDSPEAATRMPATRLRAVLPMPAAPGSVPAQGAQGDPGAARSGLRSLLRGRRAALDAEGSSAEGADRVRRARPRTSLRARVGVDHAVGSGSRDVRDVLGYQAMLPSGMAWLGADEWSLTLRIHDINYGDADPQLQEGIVERWGQMLNTFGAGSRLQVSVLNRVVADDEVAAMVGKPLVKDDLDPWRETYNQLTAGRLASRRNTLQSKYLTLVIQEPDQAKAETTLQRMAAETMAGLASIEGCEAQVLDRTERLRLIHAMTRPGEPFTFAEHAFEEAGAVSGGKASTTDYVAPWGIETPTRRGPMILTHGASRTYHATIWVRDYPRWLTDQLVAAITGVQADIAVSLHVEPFDHSEGMTLVQRSIAELEMQRFAERRRAQRQGWEEDGVPHRLEAIADDSRELREELEGSNQKIVSTLLVIGVSAATEADVEQHSQAIHAVIRRFSCVADNLAYMQREGFTTELPLGLRRVPMRRTLTTASAAVLLPFTTQECLDENGSWYGLNAHSGNPVVVDRTRTMNGNGFILGSSGSGKGVAGKNEIMNVVLDRPQDEVIIIDPEREYEPLVRALGGAVIRIDATTPARVNPMDLVLATAVDPQADSESGANLKAHDDPIARKSTDLLDMLGSLIGGVNGLTDVQRSLIDRCVVTLYQQYVDTRKNAPEQAVMPTLVDLRSSLIGTDNAEAKAVADALEIYTTGSLNTFAARTNVDIDNRIIAWDISQLGPALMSFGMMVVLDHVTQRVARNRRAGRRTWIYVDEFHVMFDNQYSTRAFRNMYKRARKVGAIPTGITQNVEELRDNEDARLMLANCDFLLLLRQSHDDAVALAEILHLSEKQRGYFHRAVHGNGLIKSGNRIVCLDGQIPEDSRLMTLFNTTFKEI